MWILHEHSGPPSVSIPVQRAELCFYTLTVRALQILHYDDDEDNDDDEDEITIPEHHKHLMIMMKKKKKKMMNSPPQNITNI